MCRSGKGVFTPPQPVGNNWPDFVRSILEQGYWQAIMASEFGGVSYAPDAAEDSWGYTPATKS